MNFSVVPQEIREINKRGGQNKLRGGLQKSRKNKRSPPPVYFEPESIVNMSPGMTLEIIRDSSQEIMKTVSLGLGHA